MEGSHFPPGQGTFRKIGGQFWGKVDVAGYTPPFFGHGKLVGTALGCYRISV